MSSVHYKLIIHNIKSILSSLRVVPSVNLCYIMYGIYLTNNQHCFQPQKCHGEGVEEYFRKQLID